MNSTRKGSCKKLSGRGIRSLLFSLGGLVWLSLTILLCDFPSLAQQPPVVPDAEASAGQLDQRSSSQRSWGNISGTVVDRTGAVVTGARIKLTGEDQSANQEVLSGNDGQFSFANIAPGAFQITVTSAGFETQSFSGALRSGETYIIPPIALAVATALTEVRVGGSPAEVAEEQVKELEKQRVLGFIPNFYVSYIPDAVALSSKQKFTLAWKTSVDPITFGLVGVIAGVQQAQNTFSGYGQGAEGYAKRYGASYANFASATFIGGAILPSLLKQDPRYFYKGSGSKKSRTLYAIANAVICKGDNGRWQANYSNIFGSFAAAGISNLYYPEDDRGVGLTFENGLIGIGATAAANVLQEFLIRKLTPNIPNSDPAKPSSMIDKVWRSLAHEGH